MIRLGTDIFFKCLFYEKLLNGHASLISPPIRLTYNSWYHNTFYKGDNYNFIFTWNSSMMDSAIWFLQR